MKASSAPVAVPKSPFDMAVQTVVDATDWLLSHPLAPALLILLALAWHLRTQTRGKSRSEVAEAWQRRRETFTRAVKNTGILVSAAGIAWVVAYGLGAINAVFAVVTAMVVTSVRVGGTIKASSQVVGATVGGLVIAEAAIATFGPGVSASLVTLAAAVLLGQLLGLGLEGGAATAVTGVLSTTLGTQLTDTVAVGRILSTLIGALVGLAFVWVINITAPTRKAEQTLAELAHRVAELLAEVASRTEEGMDAPRSEKLLVTSRELLKDVQDSQSVFLDVIATSRVRGSGAVARATALTEEYRIVEHAAESVNNMCRSMYDAVRAGTAVPAELGVAIEAAAEAWSTHASVETNDRDLELVLERAGEAAEQAVATVRNLDDTTELILSAAVLADMERLMQGPRGEAAAASVEDPKLEDPKTLWALPMLLRREDEEE